MRKKDPKTISSPILLDEDNDRQVEIIKKKSTNETWILLVRLSFENWRVDGVVMLQSEMSQQSIFPKEENNVKNQKSWLHVEMDNESVVFIIFWITKNDWQTVFLLF